MTDNLAQIVPAVLAALSGGDPVVTATVVSSPEGTGLEPGTKMLVYRDGRTIGALDSGSIQGSVVRLALEAFPAHSTTSVFLLPDGTEVRRSDPQAAAAVQILLEVVEAPATLLVVGAGHIGR